MLFCAGLPAMDTAQAVSLLLGGDRVRLQLAQHLPAGPVSVHMQQQQQQVGSRLTRLLCVGLPGMHLRTWQVVAFPGMALRAPCIAGAVHHGIAQRARPVGRVCGSWRVVPGAWLYGSRCSRMQEWAQPSWHVLGKRALSRAPERSARAIRSATPPLSAPIPATPTGTSARSRPQHYCRC